MPPIVALHNRYAADFPEKEWKRRQPGSVVLEYFIGAKGRASGITVIQSDSDDFTAMARRVLSGLEFAVTAPADQSHASAQHYRLAVVFNIRGLEPVPAIPGVPTVVITRGVDSGRF